MNNKYFFNRNLGQNFLLNYQKLSNIIKQFNKSDQILEIGAGYGALTALLPKNNLTIVEIDENLIPYLKNKFKNTNINIIQADCLKINLNSPYLISNLPYYITNQFLQKLITTTEYKKCYLMLQREVVTKIFTPQTFLYTVMHLHATPTILCKFNTQDFYPQPKVQSSFLELNFHNNISMKQFNLLKYLFKNKKRKINNLIKNNILYAQKRITELSIDEIKKLIGLPIL